MKLTPQQQAVISHISNLSPKSSSKDRLLLVSSIAGSGKTALLKAIAKTVPHTNGIMIAYNKSIAAASKKAFPKTTNCLTTHALAYKATVVPYNLKVGFFDYKSVKEKLPYESKCKVVSYLREFCLSSYLSFDEFAENSTIDKKLVPLVNKYLNLMEAGSIDVTHDFYLKMFHILLAGNHINYEPFDFVLLDEAGDVNPVTAEIFQLLPTDLRIAVGDPHQNIYSFNYTINCFSTLADIGTTFYLSKSFRVPDTLAVQVQAFCNAYLDKDMEFIGVPVKDKTITTRGFISRTNSSLIAEMIKLNKSNTPYSLVRKASEIFKLPMMISTMRKGGYVSNPQYTHIQRDFDEWFKDDTLQKVHSSALNYISSLYDDDLPLVNAIRVVQQHGRQGITEAYFEAKKHERTKYNYTLTTAHSSKGLEFDEVTLADDLNNSVAEIATFLDANPDVEPLPEQREALNLYYVSCTRALKYLNNATLLNRFKDKLQAFQKIHYPEALM